MRAAIADGSGAVTLTTVDDPAPRPTEVIVQVDSCGICGTDLHIIDGDYPAARTPIVPGHEIAGTIVARGQAHGTSRRAPSSSSTRSLNAVTATNVGVAERISA